MSRYANGDACAGCGRNLLETVAGWKRWDTRYCSNACRQRAYRARKDGAAGSRNAKPATAIATTAKRVTATPTSSSASSWRCEVEGILTRTLNGRACEVWWSEPSKRWCGSVDAQMLAVTFGSPAAARSAVEKVAMAVTAARSRSRNALERAAKR